MGRPRLRVWPRKIRDIADVLAAVGAETVGVSQNLPVAVLTRPLQWGEPPVGEGDFLLPTGTVTLLLAEMEGSAGGWQADPEGMGRAIAGLHVVVDEQVGRHDGVRPVEQRLGVVEGTLQKVHVGVEAIRDMLDRNLAGDN